MSTSPQLSRTTLMLLSALLVTSCHGKGDGDEVGGLRVLDITEQTKLLNEINWNIGSDARLAAIRIEAAFVIGADFSGDLSTRVDLPITLPAAPNETTGMILARVDGFATGVEGAGARLVAPVLYDHDRQVVTVAGDLASARLDTEESVSLKAKNQEGRYLLLSSRNGAPRLVGGSVVLRRPGQAPSAAGPWVGATISLSTSPLLALSGGKGRFLTAAFTGERMLVRAMRSGSAPFPVGTPGSASIEIADANARNLYLQDVERRAEATGVSTADLEAALGLTAPPQIQILGTMDVLDTRLSLEVPRFEEPFALTDDQEPPSRPTPDMPAEKFPPVGSVVLRTDSEDAKQTDLGCSGFNAAGRRLDLVRSGRGIDDYDNVRGWRASGDALYGYDLAYEIFGAPESLGPLYLDNIPGYCVLTTGGSQLFRAGGDLAYAAGPEDRGFATWLSQRLSVPKVAKSIQIRAAMLTQEFPRFISSLTADAISMSFDERPIPIATATLATFGEDWRAIEAPLRGDLWDIGASPSAAPGGYTGYLPPRTFCRNLEPSTEIGRNLTLRISVSDGGDPYLDTALLIDSVVFSTKACE